MGADMVLQTVSPNLDLTGRAARVGAVAELLRRGST
jgi:hypothetical protein